MLIDIQETRRSNLIRIMETLGLQSKSDLAKRTGRTDQQIGRLINGKTPFGKNLARALERELELEENTLDIVSNVEAIEHKIQFKRIPLISFVQAGNPTWNGEQCHYETIEVDRSMPDESFATRIKGDSMEPAFQEGDIVVVDTTKAPRPGSFVIARLETNSGLVETLFKQYAIVGIDSEGREVFELRPLNNIYPTLRSDVVRLDIVGVVVESRKFFR